MLTHVYKKINLNKIKIALHCSYRNLPEHFTMKTLIAQCSFRTLDTLTV